MWRFLDFNVDTSIWGQATYKIPISTRVQTHLAEAPEVQHRFAKDVIQFGLLIAQLEVDGAQVAIFGDDSELKINLKQVLADRAPIVGMYSLKIPSSLHKTINERRKRYRMKASDLVSSWFELLSLMREKGWLLVYTQNGVTEKVSVSPKDIREESNTNQNAS